MVAITSGMNGMGFTGAHFKVSQDCTITIASSNAYYKVPVSYVSAAVRESADDVLSATLRSAFISMSQIRCSSVYVRTEFDNTVSYNVGKTMIQNSPCVAYSPIPDPILLL
jgi:hypothetical protein